MTKEQLKNRKKLIRALRSGEHKQGRNYLQNPNSGGYCCQGVACDIFSRSGDVLGAWSTGDDKGFVLHGTHHFYVWPDQVQDLLGFDEDDAGELARMNDGRRGNTFIMDSELQTYTLASSCSFDEIADCMEFLTLAGL